MPRKSIVQWNHPPRPILDVEDWHKFVIALEAGTSVRKACQELPISESTLRTTRIRANTLVRGSGPNGEPLPYTVTGS